MGDLGGYRRVNGSQSCHRDGFRVGPAGHGEGRRHAGSVPDQALEFATNAADNGFEVLIAGAGKAAHLAGVMAAKSLLPVIGVPISASLDGMDALLATVQMPTGIPVATVAVDGAANAALLAVAILAVSDESLRDKLAEYRVDLAEKTLAG